VDSSALGDPDKRSKQVSRRRDNRGKDVVQKKGSPFCEERFKCYSRFSVAGDIARKKGGEKVWGGEK